MVDAGRGTRDASELRDNLPSPVSRPAAAAVGPDPSRELVRETARILRKSTRDPGHRNPDRAQGAELRESRHTSTRGAGRRC
jgi:hypothetical protein